MNIDGLMYIYKIESPIGELYIGQTKDWNLRFKSYKNKSGVKGQKFLYRSIKRFGWENFKIHLLEICLHENVNEREKHYIKTHKSYYKINTLGLNLTEGGQQGIKKKKYNHSEETKNKISISGKNRNWLRSEEHSKKLIQSTVVPILQYDLEGNFIKEFNSISEASKETNLHYSSIAQASNALNNQKIAGNYYWRRKTTETILKKLENLPIPRQKYKLNIVEKPKIKVKEKQIRSINLFTNEEIIFNSMGECKNYHNIINLKRIIRDNNGISKKKNLKFEILPQRYKN